MFIFCFASALYAHVGIVVYESKGVDARRTSNGHVALIASHLCADGIDQVRTCDSGEEPGVVLTRYSNLAYGYDRSVFVAPIRGHFMATTDSRLIPALSSGGTLDAMQIKYWRENLRAYLPPLSPERYQELKQDLERFDIGRTFRKLISMELLIGILAPHKQKSATEPIALIDPLTQELIPNGRWREAIGAAHTRRSIMITAPATIEQEERLIPFIGEVNKLPYQVLSDNCSDFVERALLKVFADSGLTLRPRMANVADAWITSPRAVATDFINYAKREEVPITVTVVPMLAGTRRPTAEITSISGGALIPNPAQGKLAFGMKVYFNTLNPLLGLTSYTADKLSRYADLERLVHERAGAKLSQVAFEIGRKTKPSDEEMRVWRREQVEVFGTSPCWKIKRDQFRTLTDQFEEVGLLTAAERRLVLKAGRPFLLPRLYERTAAAHAHAGMLMTGMQNRDLLPLGTVSNFLPEDVTQGSKAAVPNAFVPGRPEIRDMADSSQPGQQILALKIMTSVINYDLSSEPTHRRNSEAFDTDWQLFLNVAQKNDVRLLEENVLREPLQVCSCREFAEGKTNSDAFGEALGYWHWLAREVQRTAVGANR